MPKLLPVDIPRQMNSDHLHARAIEQDNYGYSEDCTLFYTEGLGPCIGVCIAWQHHAWILHSTRICYDEQDLVCPMLEAAKSVVPERLLGSIKPVVCGGDLCYSESPPDQAEEFANVVSQCRQRIIHLLIGAGFGQPHIRWNNDGETVNLVADLNRKIVTVETGLEDIVYPILV